MTVNIFGTSILVALVGILPDALIPAHDHGPISVAAGVGVGGAVTRPHSSQHQQQCYYRDQDPHT